MHDVTVSAAVTSFEFLVSEMFNGNTPPKTYTCQNCEIRESETKQIYVQKVTVVYVNMDPADNVDPINISNAKRHIVFFFSESFINLYTFPP
jgi:hypothetical protein